MGFTDDYGESAFIDESESEEVAEIDYISKPDVEYLAQFAVGGAEKAFFKKWVMNRF